MTIRVGVLGAGRIGRIHCESLKRLSDRAELHAVCDPQLDQVWAQKLMVPHLLTDEADFWRLDLDAVVIASPTTEHYQHVCRAIERGVHILCEKPLDKELLPHLAIKERLNECRSVLQIGFNRRFDDDFQKIARLNHAGDLGRPYLLRITSRDPGLPSFEYLASSGGMFLDMTIHDFDMARFVMNSEVVEVFAMGATLVDQKLTTINDIDTAVITLKFENGAFGVIDNSRQAIYGYDQRLELFASSGSAANDHHRRHTVHLSDSSGCHQESMLNFFLERYQRSYELEMMAFIKCLVENQPVSPGIDDAIKAVRLAIAAQESLVTKRPVKLERQ